MQLSLQDMFSHAQAPTKTQAETASDILDWGAKGDDIDKEMRLFVLLKNTCASAGAATFVIKFETSADNVTYTVLKTYPTVALASMVAGAMLVDGDVLPTGLKRYNKLTYTVGAADYTTGPIIDAGIVPNDMPVGR